MNNLYEIIYTPKISGKPKVVTLHAKDYQVIEESKGCDVNDPIYH